MLFVPEAAVCARIVTGYSNEAIALDLGISFHSVRTYRKRAYAKLNVTSQNELFAQVLNAGVRGTMPRQNQQQSQNPSSEQLTGHHDRSLYLRSVRTPIGRFGRCIVLGTNGRPCNHSDCSASTSHRRADSRPASSAAICARYCDYPLGLNCTPRKTSSTSRGCNLRIWT